MLHPRQRKTLSLGPGKVTQPKFEGGGNYASYRSLGDSARDLVLYLKARRINWDQINSATDYVSFLHSKGYFGASYDLYLSAVLKWMKKIKIPPAIPVLGIGILLAVVVLMVRK